MSSCEVSQALTISVLLRSDSFLLKFKLVVAAALWTAIQHTEFVLIVFNQMLRIQLLLVRFKYQNFVIVDVVHHGTRNCHY